MSKWASYRHDKVYYMTRYELYVMFDVGGCGQVSDTSIVGIWMSDNKVLEKI